MVDLFYMELDYTETERNQLRLWRRWKITFDWFNYSEPLQRVHQTLLIHRHPWSTRAIARYTNLPQTTVRRQLDILADGKVIERTKEGVQVAELQVAFNVSFHREISKFVRGGCRMNSKLLELHKKTYGSDSANFQMLENHVWWPIIDEPDANHF